MKSASEIAQSLVNIADRADRYEQVKAERDLLAGEAAMLRTALAAGLLPSHCVSIGETIRLREQALEQSPRTSQWVEAFEAMEEAANNLSIIDHDSEETIATVGYDDLMKVYEARRLAHALRARGEK